MEKCRKQNTHKKWKNKRKTARIKSPYVENGVEKWKR